MLFSEDNSFSHPMFNPFTTGNTIGRGSTFKVTTEYLPKLQKKVNKNVSSSLAVNKSYRLHCLKNFLSILKWRFNNYGQVL